MLVQLLLVVPSAEGVGEARVFRPLRVARGLAEGQPLLLVGDRDGYPLVEPLATVDVVRRHRHVQILLAALVSSVHRIVKDGLRYGGDYGLCHGHLDVLPLPRPAVVSHGGQYGEDHVHPREVVRPDGAHHSGTSFPVAGEVREACEVGRLGEVADSVLQRPGASQGLAGKHDDVRIHLGQIIVAQPKPLHNARSEVLHSHMAHLDQTLGYVGSPGVFEVDCDALFASVEVGETPCHALVHSRAALSLYLDDLRSHLAHEHGGIGTLHHLCEVGNPDSLQRQFAHCRSS